MYQCSQPFAQNLEHITVDSPGLYVLNNGLSTSVSTGGPDGALVRNMVFERKCSCYTASVKASSVSLEASIPVSFFSIYSRRVYYAKCICLPLWDLGKRTTLGIA